MAESLGDWMDLNADAILHDHKVRFQQFMHLCGRTAAQLEEHEKEHKRWFNKGRRELEHEFGKTMRYRSIRELGSGDSGSVAMLLKPIWLMSPLSVSDTLPLNENLFDVVIFDEASQIRVEEAIPALYRAKHVIVVGDDMQLPPTTFFGAGHDAPEADQDDEDLSFDLDADSFLTQTTRKLPSTLLGWHYRSRYEALIDFSNHAFYRGDLLTIPDCSVPHPDLQEILIADPAEGATRVDDLLKRSVSFHFLEQGVYEKRRNRSEARYITELVRALLAQQTGRSIGIVAFSEAQQAQIEQALQNLSQEDAAFRAQLDEEMEREQDSQFVGLFVKNLENVQGDERDIMLLSICYGYDSRRKMLMNFGPINKSGGEKRLNVIFSRAKRHMAVVSSIRHFDITNDYNVGANCLKNFLEYAEAVSAGDTRRAGRITHSLAAVADAAPIADDPVRQSIAQALRARGYEVAESVGSSRFRCDVAVRNSGDHQWRLGLVLDALGGQASVHQTLERVVQRPAVMRAFGWQILHILAKDWYHEPDAILEQIQRQLVP